MKFAAAFHPLFFAVYPVIFLYSANMGEIRFFDAFVPAFASLAIAMSLMLLLNKLLKNQEKAALIVSGCCFAFYAYGAFDQLLISLVDHQQIRGVWFPLVWLTSFFYGSSVVVNTREKLDSASGFLNIMSVILMLMVSINIALFHLTAMSADLRRDKISGNVRSSILTASGPLPDIYYLILDGYARQDVLKNKYGVEHSELAAFFAGNGFYVASQSFTNYPQTYLSLASSLNFDYLDALAAEYADKNSVQPLISMIGSNKVFSLLKQAGYTTYAFASGYSGTELREADHYLSRTLLGREFVQTLINTTFLVAMKLPFFDMTVSQADVHRERIRDTLKSLPALKLPAGPVLVFSHILCPHPPFVFSREGEPVNDQERFHIQDGSHWGGGTAAYRQQYRDQLHYFSGLVKESIASLVKDKSRSRIIIVQSDHGPGSVLDWQKPDKTDLCERFGILNAIYFSDGDYQELYPQISPVNTFRVVLNRLFAEKLPLLADRSYFAPWFGRYRFVEVTDKLLNASQPGQTH